MTKYKIGMYFIKTNTDTGSYVVGKLLMRNTKYSGNGRKWWDVNIIDNNGYGLGKNSSKIICPPFMKGFKVETFNSFSELMARLI